MKNIFGVILILASIFTSHTMAQWKKIDDTMNSPISSLVNSRANIYAGSFNDGIFISSSNYTAWTKIGYGLLVTSLAVKDTNIFAGTSSGVYLSSNNGINWEAVNSGLPINTNGFTSTVNSIFISGSNIFVGTDGGIYLSTNNGTSWTQVYSSQPNSYACRLTISDSKIIALIISLTGDYIVISTDNGQTWTEVKNSAMAFISGIYCFLFHGNNIYAGTTVGVWLSTDDGIKWTLIDNTLENAKVFSLFSTNNYIFCGTDYGVYLSSNNGNDWVNVNDGLTYIYNNSYSKKVNAFVIFDDKLFAGTDNGIWSRPLSEIVTNVETVQNYLPTEYILQQNFPNPFNPTTTISYSVPKLSFVKIKVFDLLGKNVTTLVNENKSAGNYSIEFSLNKLPSGIYLYRMQSGYFSSTKKLILLK